MGRWEGRRSSSCAGRIAAETAEAADV